MVAITNRQRKDANRTLSDFLDRYHRGLTGILKLVPQLVKRGELPKYVLEVLIDRVKAQRERHGLTMDEIRDLQNAEEACK